MNRFEIVDPGSNGGYLRSSPGCAVRKIVIDNIFLGKYERRKEQKKSTKKDLFFHVISVKRIS